VKDDPGGKLNKSVWEGGGAEETGQVRALPRSVMCIAVQTALYSIAREERCSADALGSHHQGKSLKFGGSTKW